MNHVRYPDPESSKRNNLTLGIVSPADFEVFFWDMNSGRKSVGGFPSYSFKGFFPFVFA